MHLLKHVCVSLNQYNILSSKYIKREWLLHIVFTKIKFKQQFMRLRQEKMLSIEEPACYLLVKHIHPIFHLLLHHPDYLHTHEIKINIKKKSNSPNDGNPLHKICPIFVRASIKEQRGNTCSLSKADGALFAAIRSEMEREREGSMQILLKYKSRKMHSSKVTSNNEKSWIAMYCSKGFP